MSLPGFDDHLDNYGNPNMEEDMTYTEEKTTTELEPGDMLELIGDYVFDDEYLDDPEMSPWVYEYGVVYSVEPYDGPVPGVSLITLHDGQQSYVKNSKKWKVVP